MTPPEADQSSSEQAALVDALVQTSFTTMAVLSKVGAEHDLSLTQLRVLGILRDRRLRMTELADFLGLDKSTMTGLVDRAEKRGLLERVRNADDGRAVDVRVTPLGAEVAERFSAEVARAVMSSTEALTRAEQRRLRTLLETVLARAGTL